MTHHIVCHEDRVGFGDAGLVRDVLATETPEGIAETADRIERETGLGVLRFPKLLEFFIGFRVAA